MGETRFISTFVHFLLAHYLCVLAFFFRGCKQAKSIHFIFWKQKYSFFLIWANKKCFFLKQLVF